MIIPVVTRDLIYFSKLESLISPEHRMIQIKNIEDIDKLDFANERTIFIADLNDELINELFNRKNKLSVVAYYPHVMKNLRELGEKLGCKIIITRKKLLTEINSIVNIIERDA